MCNDTITSGINYSDILSKFRVIFLRKLLYTEGILQSSSARLFQSLRATYKRERKKEIGSYVQPNIGMRRNETGRGKRRGREKELAKRRGRERERERDGQYEQSETEERT